MLLSMDVNRLSNPTIGTQSMTRLRWYNQQELLNVLIMADVSPLDADEFRRSGQNSLLNDNRGAV
jgi:hypothetical protein